jgi:protein tyrosine phosphatase (PTP) superfamily phosphohydrolase (DUF442 family)
MGLGAIKNFLAVDDQLATAGQPTEQELALIRADGFEVVVNLGLSDARYALPDEAQAARKLGLEYHHLPVEFEAPSLDDFRRFTGLMLGARGRKVFVHCAANCRVACFTALFGESELGWSREEADRHVRRAWEPNQTWLAFMTLVRASMAPPKGDSA